MKWGFAIAILFVGCNQIAGIQKPNSGTTPTGNTGDDTTGDDSTSDDTTTGGKDSGTSGSECRLGTGCDESTTCQAKSVDTRDGQCSPVGPNAQGESCTLQNAATLDASKLCVFNNLCLDSMCFQYCTEGFTLSESESAIGCDSGYLCAPAANQWGICLKDCTNDVGSCPGGTACTQEPGGTNLFWCVPPSLQ